MGPSGPGEPLDDQPTAPASWDPEGTGARPARPPGYGPAGSGAQPALRPGRGAHRVLGPGTGPGRLIGGGTGASPVLTGASPVLTRGSGAQPALRPGSGGQPVLSPGSGARPALGAPVDAARTPARGFPPVREPAEPSSPGGFGPWHTPGEPPGGGDPAGTYSPDDTYITGPRALRSAANRDAPPPRRRRGGRPKRRRRALAWLAAATVIVAGGGYAGYKFLYEPRVNAPVSPSLRLPTNVPASPGYDKALGKWQHIGTRAEDPEQLTIAALFPPQFELGGDSYVRTAASATKNCSLAVYGADLQAALQSGHCSQVLRASYISGDSTMMGTIGVVNLINSTAANKAGQVTGPQEIIAPLAGKKGATSKLSNGKGLVQAVIKGHYLILIWAEFANLKSPSGSAQRHALEQFASNLVTGSANINLSTRMLTGKP